MNDAFAGQAEIWDKPEKIKMTAKFVAEMKKYISLNKDMKAFEIGAGTGLVGLQLLPGIGSIVFEDTSAAMIGVLKSKLNGGEKVEVIEGEVFDYHRNDIDLVFSSMAFHHIVDVPAVLSHLHKITTKNAKVVIADICTEDGSFHYFEPIPHKGFDTGELADNFVKAGFKVEHASVYNIIKKTGKDDVVREYEQFILVATKL